MKPKLHKQKNCINKGLCGSRDFSDDFDPAKDCCRCKFNIDTSHIMKGFCSGCVDDSSLTNLKPLENIKK